MHPARSYEVVTRLARSAWNAPAATPAPPRRVWRDGALLAVVVAIAVIEGIVRPDLTFPVVSVLGVAAIAPTVLWRRTRPLFMLVLAVGVTTPLQLVLPDPVLYTSVFVVVLIYALYRWGSGRDLVLGSGLLLASLGVAFVRDGRFDDLIGGFALLLSVAVLGAVFRTRAGSRQRELDRIRMLEREQLARDLHDTVAHHVSAMAIRAQAGIAMAPRDPHAATDALDVIEAEAARTLGELRSMVRVLRQHESADLAPSPGLNDIHQLAGSRSGSAKVTVQVDGDESSIPPPVAAAVFRLAQESVTNALRHARQATRIDVMVRVDEGGVHVDVINDGDVAASPSPGFGIVGMMERAALLGGTCRAAPVPGGGWAVNAVLPRVGWAA